MFEFAKSLFQSLNYCIHILKQANEPYHCFVGARLSSVWEHEFKEVAINKSHIYFVYFLKGKYQQTDYVPQKPPINYEENKQNLSVERKKEYNLLMEKVLVLLHLFGVIVLSNPKNSLHTLSLYSSVHYLWFHSRTLEKVN